MPTDKPLSAKDLILSQTDTPTRNELWPDGFPSEEVLRDMRRNGQPKPEGIPEVLWLNLKNISYNHENIADLLLLGHTKKEVAEKLGITPGGVSLVTRTSLFRAYYKERRKEREYAVTRDGIHDLFDDAVDAVGDLIREEGVKDQVRLAAAQTIIDHSIGKAKQEVKVETNVLAEVMHRLDAHKKATKAESLDKPAGEFDNVFKALDSGQQLIEVTNNDESEQES